MAIPTHSGERQFANTDPNDRDAYTVANGVVHYDANANPIGVTLTDTNGNEHTYSVVDANGSTTDYADASRTEPVHSADEAGR